MNRLRRFHVGRVAAPQERRLTRRAFLIGGLAGAGAATTVGTVVAFDEALGIGGEQSVFERFVPVVLPAPAASAWPPPHQLPVLENLRRLLGGLDPGLRATLGQGLKLFNHGAVVWGLHLRPFVMLDDDAALAYCRSWEQGTAVQSGLVHAMRTFVRMSYLREPSTWPAMAYGGPVSAPAGYPRLGNAPLPPEDQPGVSEEVSPGP